ncbi:ABC transporter permease [Microvirga guangxiensis]|uniref:Lipopolysaccharide transport system permease protein n=1 Tax=Microvirga guangxiensis TaxID=549386 RepID=A0A1G5LNL5_9HYPH|nr:lipopolysaccharide transport system permease protein [Microvirga guangxiensis]
MLSSISQDNCARAQRDVVQGFNNWRIWWLLGIGDIRQRYSRSRFGQFWITLSMLVLVVAIGTVYAAIFRQPIKDYLPYLASNFVVWSLIAGIITESTSVFTQAEGILKQEPLPRTVFVWRLLVRNFVVFSHNLVIIPAVLLVFGHGLSWTWLLVPFGLLLVAASGFFMALLCGLLCTRFRDLPQIVQNVVQIAFFISPVTWPISTLGERAFYVVDLNPFASFLRIVSEPMRGQVPTLFTYASTLGVIVILALVALPLFARFRARVVYWL